MSFFINLIIILLCNFFQFNSMENKFYDSVAHVIFNARFIFIIQWLISSIIDDTYETV